jgi:hypothetical protein
MSTDKILSVDDIRATLKKMKEGVKKQPGLMKSTYRYLDAVSGYVERIANAKEEGAWVEERWKTVTAAKLPEATALRLG